MARSKYTFEKREKERAKRQKQIEKSAQRMMAKKAKAASEGEPAEMDAADPETDAEHSAGSTDDRGRS